VSFVESVAVSSKPAQYQGRWRKSGRGEYMGWWPAGHYCRRSQDSAQIGARAGIDRRMRRGTWRR